MYTKSWGGWDSNPQLFEFFIYCRNRKVLGSNPSRYNNIFQKLKSNRKWILNDQCWEICFFRILDRCVRNLQLEVKAGKHPKGQIPLSAAVYTRPGIRPRTYPRRFPHSVRLKSGKVFTLKEHALCDKTIHFVKK